MIRWKKESAQLTSDAELTTSSKKERKKEIKKERKKERNKKRKRERKKERKKDWEGQKR